MLGSSGREAEAKNTIVSTSFLPGGGISRKTLRWDLEPQTLTTEVKVSGVRGELPPSAR